MRGRCHERGQSPDVRPLALGKVQNLRDEGGGGGVVERWGEMKKSIKSVVVGEEY